MTSAAIQRFAALPTAAKLLLIISAVLLPIGMALMWIAQNGIREASDALRGRTEERAGSAVRALESLIARNALALRIAANGALAAGPSGACERAQRSLAIAPAVARRFALRDANGQLICSVGDFSVADMPMIAPGDIVLRVSADQQSLNVRVGVANGAATAPIPLQELRTAALEHSGHLASLLIQDGDRRLAIVQGQAPQAANVTWLVNQWPIGNGQLVARTASEVPRVSTFERLMLLLPLLMWIMAALIAWLLVNRLLIRPLRLLERSVGQLQPGESANLPRGLGPATEIQQLRDAFARALERIEESEREMAQALDGQRRLVREVHHRVKNNLQVIASLLNIHGRSARTPEAQDAYASIGRRVGALSIVHRNHFAEMEENRGIALRPLITELAAELRAGAPESARRMGVELDVESVNTTQDVAVSAAFLVTEIVEFAMLNSAEDAVEVSLRRTSEITARLAIGSPVLVPGEADAPDKVQFERIVGGLAKQLRSNLDRRLGRYSVDLPVFPSV